jgi:hypothetical protein
MVLNTLDDPESIETEKGMSGKNPKQNFLMFL